MAGRLVFCGQCWRFRFGSSSSYEGWIALRDEPMARAGVVAMNLTEVRCHEAAFDALEALVIRFHSEVAAVQWMMIE